MNSRTIHKALRCASFLFLVFVPVFCCAQEQAPAHWSYKGKEGPKSWGKLNAAYAGCAKGHTQSPINITGAIKSDLPALQFAYKAVPLNIINNGHTIQVNYAPGSTLTLGNRTYILQQFHFHHPSEEHVNGHGYDMVVHMVHADAQDRIAVVAVLLQRGDASAFIDAIWKNIPKEKEKTLDVPTVILNVQDLLPADHGYYTFAGSLTAPPCSEGVTWVVLKIPVTLSADQLAEFAKLYPRNARPIQPTNGREILQSK
jgi:carbonic anhydrase